MKKAKIVVASDLHLMAPEILEKDGEAFDRVLNSDRKLLVESTAIISQLLRQVKDEHPDVFLIPGDLTKDGERVSHLLLARMLKPLSELGIKTFVIPGNHDINNPLARYYSGSESGPADSVTPEEFAEIYADYGYGDGKCIERGPRLCYVAEPAPDVWILALDSCMYEVNFEERYPHTGGEIKAEVLAWTAEVMERARKEGKQVLTMTHHGLLEHFSMQSIIAHEYLINDWIRTSERIANTGVRIVFTGHFHAQDIVWRRFREGELYEIETGSAVTYPCPYRVATLYEDRLEIESYRITLKNETTGGLSLQDYAYKHLEAGIPGMTEFLIGYVQRKAPERISPEIADMIRQSVPYFKDLIMKIYTGHLEGDETGLEYNPDPADAAINPYTGDKFQELRKLAEGFIPKYAPFFVVVENTLYNASVPDNFLTIPWSNGQMSHKKGTFAGDLTSKKDN